MLSLIQAPGQARARAAEFGGQAAAQAELARGQGNAQIAGAVGNTLSNLVQAPARAREIDLQAQADKLKSRVMTEQTHELDDKDLIQKVMQATGNDPDATVKELEASGHHDAASAVRSQVHATRMQALDETDKQLKVSAERIKQAQSLLPSPPDDPTDQSAMDDFRRRYAQALPSIQKIVGDDIGKTLPSPDDPNLSAGVSRLQEFGASLTERTAMRRAAIAAAQAAVAKAKEGRDADADWTKSLGKYLSTVDSQEEWAQALANAKHAGATDLTLSKFSPTYSPEAAAKALKLVETPTQAAGPKLGSDEAYLAKWATDHGIDPAKMTAAQQNQAAAEKAAATRAPDKGPSTEATIAQKATAERWKADQLEQLEERYRASNAPYRTATGIDVPKDKNGQPEYFYDKTGAPIIPMTEADLQKAKAQVQRSFLAQISATTQASSPSSTAPASPAAPPKPGTKTTTAAPDYGYGNRYNNGDPSTAKPKGLGFFGPLKRADGGVMSEYSVGVEIDGKETEIPTLVPTLTKAEVSHILAMKDGDKLPEAIVEKARKFAEQRIAQGKDPFAGPGEQQALYPDLKREAAPQTRAPQATAPQTLLKGQKPGKYTLTDGSVWIVDPSGGVNPAK